MLVNASPMNYVSILGHYRIPSIRSIGLWLVLSDLGALVTSLTSAHISNCNLILWQYEQHGQLACFSAIPTANAIIAAVYHTSEIQLNQLLFITLMLVQNSKIT